MKNVAPSPVAADSGASSRSEQDVRMHLNLLGHGKLGVTELRVFDPLPHVACRANCP